MSVMYPSMIFICHLKRLECLHKQTNFDPLYRFRGNPGSHDTDMLQKSLQALKDGKEAAIPIFDKTLEMDSGIDRDGVWSILPTSSCWRDGSSDSNLISMRPKS